MIQDPAARGRALADFYRAVAPRLLADLEESGLLPAGSTAVARDEWECFALYACVRGLVAAGGFNRETAAAIDAFHESALQSMLESDPALEAFQSRRARIAERYAEYGTIGQDGGASGAATVATRLGAAAARHMAAPHDATEGLAQLAGGLHEALAEGAAEAVRAAA
jgi:hypothetical protein